MAWVTKVCGSKTEIDCEGTTVTTLVFKEVCAMFWTHLSQRHVRTASTYKFFRVIGIRVSFFSSNCSLLFLFVDESGLDITSDFASVVGLVTLTAHIVGIPLHCKGQRILEEPASRTCDGRVLVQSFVFESHARLSLHVLQENTNGSQQSSKNRMIHGCLADGTLTKSKSNSRTRPSLFQNPLAAVEVENMTALELNGWGGR